MALKPLFAKFNFERDAWEWGLLPDDFNKVVQGYACSKCLAEWDHYRAACTTCGHPTPQPDIFDRPPEWDRQHDNAGRKDLE